ncbi:phage tail protein [Vibrio parahaemolyticus]|uniref:phage tail-collar fiber domain-containing protein n=1 Tax=Vibrio parahaemolyticus TaxID=670 RepID=UPI001781C686|nr:phage tail protein [Vibrio parahaemolyticus]MBD6946522.1 phage tail protein [Vibrio parahaemolyticus]MBD6960110.1 phage tail protein [Vibrio parahaemolyticus]MBD6979218.1 phage tail protein [Vibrio parahaemolyticus]MBD6992315.1 phage tail protein [Vibrio parahaemolyticus]
MTLAVTITEQGLAECISAKENGIRAWIKWISAGDRAYTPSPTQTVLQNEKQRVEISEYKDTGATSLQCTAKFSGDDEYAIREIGIWLSSGTLLGVISAPNTTLNYKAAKAHVVIPFTMDLSALPTDSLEVVVGVENINILIDTEMMKDAVAFIRSQVVQTKQSHMLMQQAERLRQLETN